MSSQPHLLALDPFALTIFVTSDSNNGHLWPARAAQTHFNAAFRTVIHSSYSDGGLQMCLRSVVQPQSMSCLTSWRRVHGQASSTGLQAPGDTFETQDLLRGFYSFRKTGDPSGSAPDGP